MMMIIIYHTPERYKPFVDKWSSHFLFNQRDGTISYIPEETRAQQ